MKQLHQILTPSGVLELRTHPAAKALFGKIIPPPSWATVQDGRKHWLYLYQGENTDQRTAQAHESAEHLLAVAMQHYAQPPAAVAS